MDEGWRGSTSGCPRHRHMTVFQYVCPKKHQVGLSCSWNPIKARYTLFCQATGSHSQTFKGAVDLYTGIYYLGPPTGGSWWQQMPRNHLLGYQNSLLEGAGIYIYIPFPKHWHPASLLFYLPRLVPPPQKNYAIDVGTGFGVCFSRPKISPTQKTLGFSGHATD